MSMTMLPCMFNAESFIQEGSLIKIFMFQKQNSNKMHCRNNTHVQKYEHAYHTRLLKSSIFWAHLKSIQNKSVVFLISNLKQVSFSLIKVKSLGNTLHLLVFNKWNLIVIWPVDRKKINFTEESTAYLSYKNLCPQCISIPWINHIIWCCISSEGNLRRQYNVCNLERESRS